MHAIPAEWAHISFPACRAPPTYGRFQTPVAGLQPGLDPTVEAARGQLGDIICRARDFREPGGFGSAYAGTHLALGCPGMGGLTWFPGPGRGEDLPRIQFHPRERCLSCFGGVHRMRDQDFDSQGREPSPKQQDVGSEAFRGRLFHGNFVEIEVGQWQPSLPWALPPCARGAGIRDPGAGNQEPRRAGAFAAEGFPEDPGDPMLDPHVKGCFGRAEAMALVGEMMGTDGPLAQQQRGAATWAPVALIGRGILGPHQVARRSDAQRHFERLHGLSFQPAGGANSHPLRCASGKVVPGIRAKPGGTRPV